MKRSLAWGACGLTVAFAAARLGLAIFDPDSSSSATDPLVSGGGLLVAMFEAVVLVALGAIAAVVASRQPHNPVGWLLCGVPVSLGLLIVGSHVFWRLEADGSAAAGAVAWITTWIWVPGVVPALILFPLLFPSGSALSPRWRRIVWVAIAACIALLVGFAFTPGRFEDYPVENPLGATAALEIPVVAIGGLGFLLQLIAMIASAASLVVRFRRSYDEERQQLKWVAAATALFVVLFISDQLAGEDVGFPSLLLGLLIMESAIAVAILRYRLYDIDVVINRALVYGSLTAALTAVYFGSVLLLQLGLNGVTEGSSLAVAASTLAVAALFRPARARIQSAVDRRFFRHRYDAALTLEAFGARLRDEVDLDSLDGEIRAVAAGTMQPAHVSLWLRKPEATA